MGPDGSLKSSNAHKMRIIIFLALLFVKMGAFGQINAGDPKNQEFRLFDGGFTGGFNFSQVDGDLYAGFNKAGFTAGPIIHINFTRTWSTSIELTYSQKGARNAPNPNLPNEYILKLDYAEIPVLANYNDKNRLIFQAGLAYGRLIKVDEKLNGATITNEEAYYNDELSYIIGGTFLVGEMKHWGVNVRYQGSITTIGESANPAIVGKINRLITFKAIYYI